MPDDMNIKRLSAQERFQCAEALREAREGYIEAYGAEAYMARIEGELRVYQSKLEMNRSFDKIRRES